MANTITNTRILANQKRVIQYVTISSDGSEETDLVIYDSSVVATALGITDPLTCTILDVYASASAAAPAVSGAGARVWLEFDASTDVLALDIPAGTNPTKTNFEMSFGGLKNTSGSGITGDVTLSTAGLESGDKITIILQVKPH